MFYIYLASYVDYFIVHDLGLIFFTNSWLVFLRGTTYVLQILDSFLVLVESVLKMLRFACEVSFTAQIYRPLDFTYLLQKKNN